MPAPQFILDYTGSKYQESKHIDILNIDFDKYETIIEPFGGSFGFSRYLHEKKKLTHLNYIIYDNDEELIKFYQYFKSLIIENKHIDFINEYNEEVQKIKDNCSPIKTSPTKLINGKELRVYLNNYKHENIYMDYLVQKNHAQQSRFSKTVFKKNCGFLEFMKSATFIFSNFEDIDDDILTNKKTLIYFDPPYIATDNSPYKNINLNKAFEKMIELYKLVPCLMVHQYNFLLSYVFKDYKQCEYNKQYNLTKKNVKHHFIYNF